MTRKNTLRLVALTTDSKNLAAASAQSGTLANRHIPEVMANARLIASAPDLLAALYSIATDPSAIYSGANAHIGDIARAAIAKATGGAA